MANGSGGCDWSALPLAVAHFGVVDVPGLVQRLLVIKLHKRTKQDEPE